MGAPSRALPRTRADAMDPGHPIADEIERLLQGAREADHEGRTSEGETLLLQAAHHASVTEPDLWPLTQYELASHYEGLGQWAEAESVHRGLLARQEAEGTMERVATLELLAEVVARQGRAGEARQLYEASIALQVGAVGPYHPEVANSHRDLARCLHAAGMLRDAEDAYVRMVSIRERYHGKSGAAAVPALLELARFYVETDRPDDAIPVYRRALAAGEMIEAGTDDARAGLLAPVMQDIRRELAHLYRHFNRLDDADALEREAFRRPN